MTNLTECPLAYASSASATSAAIWSGRGIVRVLRAIVMVIARPDFRARRISSPLCDEEGEMGAVGVLRAARSSRRPARVDGFADGLGVGFGDGFGDGLGDDFVDTCLEALFRAFGDGSGVRVGCFGFGINEAYASNEINASPARRF
jgi:hypothetical protein